jgi:hypothetical protein
MKKKMNQKQWELAIRQARQFVANYAKTRWKIVAIAESVCDISVGGRGKETVYTVRRFAEAIEIHEHTLYEWIRTKRLVLDKLPARYTNHPEKLSYGDLHEVCGKVDQKTTPKEVLSHYMTVTKEKPENRKFIKYNRVLNSILYNAQRPLNMTEVDEEVLKPIIDKCNTIVGLLTTELQLREKFTMQERVMKKHKKQQKALELVANI